MKRTIKPLNFAIATAMLGLLGGCGGGGGGGGGGSTGTPPPGGTTQPPSATQFTLGGTVSGLGPGATVTLANGTQTLPVSANGTFAFPTKLAAGTAYTIAATAPGGYSCKVTDGAGTMAGADSTKTAVACAPMLLAGAVTALQEPQGVTGDGNGNLYVVDGGPNAILKFSSTGAMTVLAGGTGKPGYADGPGATARFRFRLGSDVLLDPQGNLFVSDECNGMIRKVTPDGTVSTFAGSGSTFCNNVVAANAGPVNVDGVGAAAKFEHPNRMVSDGAGGVIVVDSFVGATVRMVSAAGAVTTKTWAAPSGTTAAPVFYTIARGNDGTLYFSDFESRIWKDVNGSLVLLAGTIVPIAPTDGTGSSAKFGAITDMVVAPSGDLYVGDTSMVRRVTTAGQVVTIAGNTSRGFNDGQGPAARFSSVRSMGMDGNTIIVVDNDPGVLRRVTLDGNVTTLAATPAVRGSFDGTGAGARFNWHNSLAADASGSLYVVDSITHVVRKTSPDGVVTTIAGKANTAGTTDGPVATALFDRPNEIAAGADGSLWVVQTRGLRRIANGTVTTVSPTLAATNVAVEPDGNAIVVSAGLVQRITPAGAATTLADTAKIAGLIGVPTARFTPQSVVVDGAGNIYFSDTGTVAVYKLAKTGELTVFAGTPLKEAGDIDGPVGTATLGFYEVEYMTMDEAGNLYLSGQGSVRKISPAGVVSTPDFVWGKAPIGAVAYAKGKLYGMTRYALLQSYLP